MHLTILAAAMRLVFFHAAPTPVDSTQQDTVHRPSWYTLHTQETVVIQDDPPFHAKYSGPNSLADSGETKTSITSTLFMGARLWQGAGIYLNPELSGGQGLSGTTGIAGFPNGEIYRVGVAAPVIVVARLYLQQTFNLGGDTTVIPESPNQLEMPTTDSRLTLSLGKFSIVDFFDDNTYSHDSRSQFLNWSIMDNGAWDYAADTRGYTEGLAAEWRFSHYTVRLAEVAVPITANGEDLQLTSGAHSEAIELEDRYQLCGNDGVARAIYYHNVAHMGSYRDAIDSGSAGKGYDITKTETYGRVKYGFGIDLEQKLSDNVGAFLRAGWNDGATETWAFTEIDRTVSAGLSFAGAPWSRPLDCIGVAGVVNGLSQDHEEYLADGGVGFIIGDGALNYQPEEIIEVYYLFAMSEHIAFTGDFQGVRNPAYNADRGPVAIFSLRAHFEF